MWWIAGRTARSKCGGVKTPPYGTSENGLAIRKTALPLHVRGPHACGPYSLPEREGYKIPFPSVRRAGS